ncbi:hypothetical protein ACFQ9H_05275 [Streptomyces sp. NPDC056517]|uniref:hypothetical protein n=1 Tax=unclassified Streptomyces TaxID=2593676 RepID=UPI0036C64F41
MIERSHLPEALVRKRVEELRASCRKAGRRPSVLALARQLGLSNTTFRRHYPDIAREIAAHRSAAAPSRDRPSEQDKIIARNSRLRRRNRELTVQLKLAAAQIQHLALANASLLEALQQATNITRLSKFSFLNRRYAAAERQGHRDRVLPGLVRHRPAEPGRGVVRRVRRRRRLGEAVHLPAPNRWRW